MMLIDCGSCTARGAACAGCMMSALIDAPPQAAQRDGPRPGAQLAAAEQRAIEVLARAGLDVEVLAQTASAPRRSSRRRAYGRRNVA
jgi:hypothetical protein